MEYDGFVDHCETLHRKHFGGRAALVQKWPFIRKPVRSYYGRAKKYGDRWQVKIAHQTLSLPDWVRDYVICHELAHCIDNTRHFGAMHTPQYWALLRAAYPRTDDAERWLKSQGRTGRLVDVSSVAGFKPYNDPVGLLKRKYPVGTCVNYADGRGGDHVGTVLRHSRKTMTISVDGATRGWRIPWSLVDDSIIDVL